MNTLKRIFLMVISLNIVLFTPPVRTGAEEDVHKATLKNGLQVVIVRNPLAPVASTMLTYRAGSIEAPKGFPGTAHALEHMMFRGSPDLSAGQLANLIANMGGEFNAATQHMATQYFLTVPADLLDIALKIEAVRMKDILSTQELWLEERGALDQEVAQNLSNPLYHFSVRLLSELFAGTPYAQDALGSRPSFQKTTGGMLKDFYRSWYVPNNAVLVIVGDIDAAKTMALVRRLFERIPSRPLPPRPEVRLQPLKADELALETDLPAGLAVVSYRLPGFNSPDHAAAQVLSDALNSKRGDLFGFAAEGKALSAGFDTDVLPKAAIGYAIAEFPLGGDGREIIGELKKIIAGYVKNGIPADLVEAAKRRKITELEFDKTSIPGLAASWSQAIAIEGLSSPDDKIEAIRKVTVEEVNRAARAYLINETAFTAVLTPRNSGKPVISPDAGKMESFAPKQVRPVQLPAWAKKTAELPPVPAIRMSASVVNLPNGLRLIIQPETVSSAVNVYGQVRSRPELQAPPGKEGVDQVLDQLLSYGTRQYDRLAFQRELDNICAELSAGTSFSLKVLADRFDRGIQLLAENLLRPALPEPAFLIVRQETAASVAGLLQSPSYLAHRSLLEALYPKDDPALREAVPKTVSSLALRDVKSYYRNVFRPDMTTIVVIGRISPEQAENVVKKYFGEWKAEGPKPATDLPPAPPNKPFAASVPDSSRVQDSVTLAQTIGITRTHPDYYLLNLGNNVLSGAFYATRLYRDLRQNAGLVYTVDSVLQAGKTRSMFGVMYACDPPNVSRARALIEHNLREMQTSRVSGNELRQAQTLLIRKIPLSRSSFEGTATNYLLLTKEYLPLNEPIDAARRYRQATAEQVQQAFSKWMRPQDFVQVVLGPAKE